MQFEIGEKVDLIYPFDLKWWKTDCYVYSKEDNQGNCIIINGDGEVLQVSSMYLRKPYKPNFDQFKEEVQEYLKSKEEVSAFRVSQQGRIFTVSLMLKLEYWMAFKLTNETEFYSPIYDAYVNNKPDYSTEIKINIYCKNWRD